MRLTRKTFFLSGAVAGMTLALLTFGRISVTAAQQDKTDPDTLKPIVPTKETPLFDGKDLTGWYTFLPSKGMDNDPDRIFVVEDGAVHVSGKEFGYFATRVPYANYHLRLEVKWGEKKWPPRDKENTPRDAGLLVHVIGKDKVWPRSFECQIQENDFGDIFHLDGISSLVNGKRQNGRAVRSMNYEKPRGEWNTVEVIVKGDAVTNIVNGHVVNVATDMTRGKDGMGGKLDFGRIALQSEGAEIFYRNIVIMPLPAKGQKTE